MAEEKIQAAEVLSEEELDGVAGGNSDQNHELLNLMLQLDPSATKNFLKNWDQRADDAESRLEYGLSRIMQNYMKATGLDKNNTHFALSAGKVDNLYTINGKQVSHKEFMNYLDTSF